MTTKLTNKIALSLAMESFLDNHVDETEEVFFSDATATFTVREVAEKLQKMIDSLDKKASGERKPTAAQQANAIIKDEIVKALEGRHLSAREIADTLNLDSSSKAAALLHQLVKAGKVRKEEGEKGKAVYIAA